MYIRGLIWDEVNVLHISDHKVEPDEVEEVVFGRFHARRGRGEGRYLLYGQTGEGRYLLVVIDRDADDLWYVVTAREMDSRERQLFRRVRRK